MTLSTDRGALQSGVNVQSRLTIIELPEANAAPEVLRAHPIITLASGQSWAVRKIMLYPADRVNEVADLTAEAAKLFGGFKTGVGFLGSPTWALGGAAALGLL